MYDESSPVRHSGGTIFTYGRRDDNVVEGTEKSKKTLLSDSVVCLSIPNDKKGMCERVVGYKGFQSARGEVYVTAAWYWRAWSGLGHATIVTSQMEKKGGGAIWFRGQNCAKVRIPVNPSPIAERQGTLGKHRSVAIATCARSTAST